MMLGDRIMNKKMFAAMFIAAGLFATTNSAWADREIVRTETVQPVAAETTTTTTSDNAGSAVVVRDHHHHHLFRF
jgi:hypothetical protein